VVPVTNVATGKVRLHHVNANGMPRRSVRTVNWVASVIHSSANPHTGTPNSTAKTFIAPARSGGTANAALAPSRPAAVMPWPSGPRTIHSVGTRVVPDVP
jgi:hypothetical protein